MRRQLIPLSAILATAALAQSPPPTLTVPPTNITSGTASYEAENAITTGGNAINISGSASVLFQVLNTSQTTITLLPGFHAKAGSAQPTFKALIGPLAGNPTQVSGTQQINAPQTITFTLQNTGDSNPIAGGDITFLVLDGNGNVQAQCPVELSTNSMTFWLLDTGTSSDSTCSIGSSSSMSIGSEVVTVNLNLTFFTAGTYTVTTDAIDSAGILFPFQAAGTWTVDQPWSFTMNQPSVSPVTVTPTAAQASYNQTFQGINGFSGPVSLSYQYNGGSLPPGLSFSLNALTVSGPTAITAATTVSAAQGTPAGTYPINIVATAGTATGTVTRTASIAVTVTPPPSFSVTVPLSLTISNNTTWTGFTATITGSYGFSAPVSIMALEVLDVQGHAYSTSGPLNVSFSSGPWTPDPISGKVNATGMIEALASFSPGFYYVYCQANSGSIAYPFEFTLTVNSSTPPSDFSLSPSSLSVPVTAGGSPYTFPVTISPLNSANTGWTGSFTTIGTSPPGWPSGVNVTVTPSTFSNLPSSATVAITAYSSAPSGTYSTSISVTATNPSTQQPVTHTIPITLIIGNSPAFTISASPGSQTANSQNAAVYQINVNGVNGFNRNVTFTANVPAGYTASFAPAYVTGSGTAAMKITGKPEVTQKTLTITAIGTSSDGTANAVPISMTTNLVTSPGQGTIDYPLPGGAIPVCDPVFVWDPGNGVSQYQLFISSLPRGQGGQNLYTSPLLPQGTRSLYLTLPRGFPTVYAWLASDIGDTWDYDDASYTSDCGDTFNGTYLAPNIAYPSVQPTVTNNSQMWSPQYPQSYNYTTDQGDPSYFTSCYANQTGNPTDRGPGLYLSAFIVNVLNSRQFTVQYTAFDDVPAGNYNVFCSWENPQTGAIYYVPLNDGITVYDASPYISGVTTNPPLYAGDQSYDVVLTITGHNFGAPNQLVFCKSGTCDPNTNFTTDISAYIPLGGWTDDTITATLAASSSASGPYYVAVISNGAGGNGLLAAPGGGQNKAQAQGPNVSGPTISSISPAMIPVATTTPVTIKGAGLSGVNTITAQGVTFSIQSTTNGQLVANVTVGSADKGGTVSLTVSVDNSTSNPANLKKQVPSRLVRFDYPPSAPGGVGGLQTPIGASILDLSGNVFANLTNQCGVYRWYVYDLVDQDGQPISANFTLNEIFTNYSGVGGAGYQPPYTPVAYSPGQLLADIQLLAKTYPACLGPNDNETFNQGFIITINNTNFNLSTLINVQRGNFAGTLAVNESITTP